MRELINPSLFDIVSKIENSNATVSELRVPIFSPIEKVSHNSSIAVTFRKNNGIRTIKTPWGEVTTRGRALLGQQHRDLLDCIYLNATKYITSENGSIRIIFCRTHVLSSYFKSESSKTNHKWLDVKLKEIRDTSVEYKNTNGDSFDFNIIKHLDFNADTEEFAIDLDERYVKFYSEDLSVNYKKLLPQIMEVENSVIKAIVRFLLSHSTIKIGLEKALHTIGYPFDSLSKAAQYKFLKELMAQTESLAFRFGINYDKFYKTFDYTKNGDVFFLSSLKKQAAILVEKKSTPIAQLTDNENTPQFFIGKTITRDFNQDGTKISASICDLREIEKERFEIILEYPNGTRSTVDSLYSLLEIKKIISL